MANGPRLQGIDLPRLREMFLEEARDLLAALESGLLGLEDRGDRRDLLDDVFRAAHSLKGGAATVGFAELGELTHALETVLDSWRSGGRRPTRAEVGIMLSALDVVRETLDAARTDRSAPDVRPLRDRLLALAAAPPPLGDGAEPGRGASLAAPPEPAPPGQYAITFVPHAEAGVQGPDPLLVLRELRELATTFEIAVDDQGLPELAAMEAERSYLRWHIRLTAAPGVGERELRDAFSFVEDIADVTIGPEPATPVAGAGTRAREARAPDQGAAAPPPPAGNLTLGMESTTIRVATGKVDKIVDLVGELVIAQLAVREYVKSFTPEKLTALQEAVLVSERYLRELQARVMGIRMVAVGAVLGRLPRVVRELGAALGKEVDLEIRGGETELDKGLAERLGDPVLHLVRNALDHGLETPEERVRAGKPATGRLIVTAHAHGGSVHVEVSDDGRGLDRARIFAKAVERGLVAADAQLDDDDIVGLVCAPGFSTAEAVTAVSGRGVGLDVVRQNVQAIGGDLGIHSEPGRGARFEIRLPLTLTILDGLLIRAGSETCVLPLTEVAFSLRVRPGQLQRLGGAAPVLHLQGETVPAVVLSRLLNAPGTDAGEPQLAVVVKSGGLHYALLVDELLGQSQIVVKSLETHFRRVGGIMGATILGDGRVALIIDAQAIGGLAGVRRQIDSHLFTPSSEVRAS